MGLPVRVFICIATLSLCLYSIINEQNKITKLRLEIPAVTKSIQEIEEETIRLRYQIECFNNPLHLMALSRLSEYSHLKYPKSHQISIISVSERRKVFEVASSQEIQLPSKLSLATLLFQEEFTGR